VAGARHDAAVKWAVLVVVVILVAPSIAKRLEALDPDKRGDAAGTGSGRRGGLVYRAVRRFGPRRTFIVFVLFLGILAVAAYLLIRSL